MPTFQADETREFFFEEGCHILELLNDPEDPDVSIARARVPAGGVTHWHCLHGSTERYVILQGRGVVSVGDEPDCPVGAGDVVLIPPGVRQRIRNKGSQDLVFLAVCSPRFRVENYEAI